MLVAAMPHPVLPETENRIAHAALYRRRVASNQLFRSPRHVLVVQDIPRDARLGLERPAQAFKGGWHWLLQLTLNLSRGKHKDPIAADE